MKRLASASLIFLFACSTWAGRTGEGEGEVLGVSPESKSVLIHHGEIKDMMGEMTMEFTVDDASLLKGVKQGDRVHFTLEQRPPFDYVILKMTVIPPAPAQ